MLGVRKVSFCDLAAAHAVRGPATEAALLRVARAGRYVLGPEVAAFETEFADACGTEHVVGVGSCTDALALILRASGIGAGDEVIVPAYTATATWMAVAMSGATPVGADTEKDTGLIDAAAVAAAVGPRTAAIIAVHLFGRLAPMRALRALAGERGLLLIEDAAHAPAVEEPEGRAGALGDAAAFSFYPTKPLGGLGDAGAVSTDDDELAAAVRRLRSYGWSDWQGQADGTGVNSRLDEIQAAVLRVRLAELAGAQERLRTMARRLRRELRDCPGLRLPPPLPDGGETPWHQFVVRHRRRDALRDLLDETGIGTMVHYEPLPPQLRSFALQGALHADEAFPNATEDAASALSLPFDPWLSDDQAMAVCEGVVSATGRLARSST